MNEKYLCHMKCHYLNKIWNVGEELWKGYPPNKHFSLESEYEDNLLEVSKVPLVAGDDPRSTVQMREEVMVRFPDAGVTKKTTRKELFAIWKEGVTAEEGKPPVVVTPDEKNPPKMVTKRFADLTPDEVAGLKLKDIQHTVLTKFKHQLEIVGARKVDLVKKAIKLEEKHGGMLAP